MEPVRRRRWLAVLIGLAGLILILYGAAAWVVTQPASTPKPGGNPPAVDLGRLEAHVRALSETFVPRDSRHVENLDRAADYVKAELLRAGARVSEQAYEVQGRTYRNILGRFGPEAGERVVVGAHYDAFGSHPGADDNASGVAGILELALMFKADPPMFPVELVAYTLEEPPHFRTSRMGSRRHARELRSQAVPVCAMLSLEMIGYFSDQPGSQRFPAPLVGAWYPDRGNFIAVVGRLSDGALTRRVKRAMAGATPLPVRSMNAPRTVPGVDYSDHHPYWDEGFPALMVTDGAFLRNTAYHTAGDTADRLDYRRMAQVIQGVHAAVRDLGR